MKTPVLVLTLVIAVLANTVLADPTPPSTQPAPGVAAKPTNTAANRAAKLKLHLEDFQLTLDCDFGKDTDKPHNLLLTTAALKPAPPPPDAGAPDPGAVEARIDADQAKAIIDYLALDGFLDGAVHIRLYGPGVMAPRSILTVGTLREDFNWNPHALRRFDGLRALLKGDAAKALDRILENLAEQRKLWHDKPYTAAAAKRVEEMKKKAAESFHLQVQYAGLAGSDLGSVNLGVGPQPDKSASPAKYIQIKPDQAIRIIETLGESGQFDNAWQWGVGNGGAGGMYRYFLITNQWGSEWGYGPRLAEHMVMLRHCVDGPAATAIDEMLTTIDEAQKTKWRAEEDYPPDSRPPVKGTSRI